MPFGPSAAGELPALWRRRWDCCDVEVDFGLNLPDFSPFPVSEVTLRDMEPDPGALRLLPSFSPVVASVVNLKF